MKNVRCFILLLILFTGCEKTTSPTLVRITPDILNFGKMRSLDSPAHLSFDIENTGRKSLLIEDITSGCGCTVIDVPKKLIPPGQKITASVKVNLTGRSGDFRNQVRIKTDSSADIFVDICGNIVTDIWYDGQPLRCTAEREQKRISTILVLQTVDFPNVTFEEHRQDKGVTISEISRNTQEGTTSIKFSVTVEMDESADIIRFIHIIPTNANIAPLTIPFYCYRND